MGPGGDSHFYTVLSVGHLLMVGRVPIYSSRSTLVVSGHNDNCLIDQPHATRIPTVMASKVNNLLWAIINKLC